MTVAAFWLFGPIRFRNVCGGCEMWYIVRAHVPRAIGFSFTPQCATLVVSGRSFLVRYWPMSDI